MLTNFFSLKYMVKDYSAAVLMMLDLKVCQHFSYETLFSGIYNF